MFATRSHDYLHETRIIDLITTTVTGTVVSKDNYKLIATQLHRECAYAHLSFDLSAPLCDALQKCYTLWHVHLSGAKDKKVAAQQAKRKWPPWRSLASKAEIAKKSTKKARGNNYDGRNYINE